MSHDMVFTAWTAVELTASQLYELANVIQILQILQFGQAVFVSLQGHKEIEYKIENRARTPMFTIVCLGRCVPHHRLSRGNSLLQSYASLHALYYCFIGIILLNCVAICLFLLV